MEVGCSVFKEEMIRGRKIAYHRKFLAEDVVPEPSNKIQEEMPSTYVTVDME